MKGYMYILECADGSYYTGSTNNLELRLAQHQAGEGANHTKKRLPVKLVYFEEYTRIDEAFYREKQVQGWSRKKKEALIMNMPEKLHELAKCMNESSHLNYNGGFGSAQPPSVQPPSAQPPSAQPPSAQPPSAQPPSARCLSEVEGSEVEGSEVEGSEVEGSEVEGSEVKCESPEQKNEFEGL
ncbi:GIY-YIG nuclease family protein [hot springs metagenome]|uniref:GIY-YIG nuclease family protein n=1 Tax=hot springs metagenome TaxID=433727 RepID=A0A5J4L4B6_9ZZZZ